MNPIERSIRATATRVYQGAVPDAVRTALRHRLVLHRVTRRLYADYRELDAIDSALARIAQGSPVLLNGFPTAGMTERVVEIPWAVAQYHGERRVLDVGPAYALPLYLDALRRLRIPELQGVDLSARKIRGMMVTRADVRQMPFADASFDLITCVSTLEHIGRDNAHYQVAAPPDTAEGDLVALREMRRVLDRNGRILITVPFGRLDIQSWQKQYDLQAWESLLQQAALRAQETTCFRYSPAGWQRVNQPELLAGCEYRGNGAPGATGVLCAVLGR